METIFVDCWYKLSQLSMLSKDRHLCLLLKEDAAVKRSSRVGIGMEGLEALQRGWRVSWTC